MEASMIWKKLLVDGKTIATTEDIKKIAREIGRDERRSIFYLLEEGYMFRVLRGIYYVRNIKERAERRQERPLYEIVAMALKVKGVKNWYFAMETALKMNLMTHEYFFIDYVITDSYRTTKVISIAGQKFRFFKRGTRHFGEGIVRVKNLRHSDPEKTVLDLAYREYIRTGTPERYLGAITEHLGRMDPEKTGRYLACYPREFGRNVGALI